MEKSTVSLNCITSVPVCMLMDTKEARDGALVSLMKLDTPRRACGFTASSDMSLIAARGTVMKQSFAAALVHSPLLDFTVFRSVLLSSTLTMLLLPWSM